MFIKSNYQGILVCLLIAIPAFILGKLFPIIGGPVIAILLGMLVALVLKDPTRDNLKAGIGFCSKFILQLSVVLLGFGLNLNVLLQTGLQSLPIIIATICIALIVTYVLYKTLKLPQQMSILIGVGSSICGGSAIAATAPIIKANDEQVAQAISVVFTFNVLAAIIFPSLATLIGMDHLSGQAFGIFAGTAVNDTSSVTAAAASWDSMWELGHQTLDQAVIVKLTRTLAIIPITLALALLFSKKESLQSDAKSGYSFIRSIPKFVIFFILASVITTVGVALGINDSFFSPLKQLAVMLIVLAMAAIGLNCNLVKMIKTGFYPLLLGLCCWAGITVVSLVLQYNLELF